MKLTSKRRSRWQGGYALLLVMAFIAAGLLTMGGVLSWSSNTSANIERNNQYYRTMAAAEAGTEKVLAQMARDFQKSGQKEVTDNLSAYRDLTPAGGEAAYWSNYAYRDNSGVSNKVTVTEVRSEVYTNLQSQYTGLQGYLSQYELISSASEVSSLYRIPVGIKQEVQTCSIPIFQFAIFYGIDMELNPGRDMNVWGRVHSNRMLYTVPDGSTLTYWGNVTSVSNILIGPHPLDPNQSRAGTVVFKKAHDSKVPTLNLPVRTDVTTITPAEMHKIIELPNVGDEPQLQKEKLYNKADLIILVGNSGQTAEAVTYSAGVATRTAVGWTNVEAFVTTTNCFKDDREEAWEKVVDIDVGALKTWVNTNAAIVAALGNTNKVHTLYVADTRAYSGGNTTNPAVRLVNGRYLPTNGLTVVTQNPIYVKGDYNAPTLNTNWTGDTQPAAILADAVNIQSRLWSDAHSTDAVANRDPAETTINAATLGGIVETYTGHYSGGCENFLRLHENWNGKNLWYNGSIVMLFPSQKALGTWGKSGVYSVPTRKWAYDTNFNDPNKLPPNTPMVRTIIRGSWSVVAGGS